MPNKALVLVAAAVLEAREKPSTYSSRRPGRHVPTSVDQVVSFTIATDDVMVTVPPPLPTKRGSIHALGHYSTAFSRGSDAARARASWSASSATRLRISRSMQRDGDAVGCDVDPLDQQPQDPRLLGRVQLVPDRLQRAR
jgi:hypothetical protein